MTEAYGLRPAESHDNALQVRGISGLGDVSDAPSFVVHGSMDNIKTEVREVKNIPTHELTAEFKERTRPAASENCCRIAGSPQSPPPERQPCPPRAVNMDLPDAYVQGSGCQAIAGCLWGARLHPRIGDGAVWWRETSLRGSDGAVSNGRIGRYS